MVHTTEAANHDRDILWFSEIGKDDISSVGGKGANLGEMFNNGIPIPDGFCISAKAYEHFLEKEELKSIIKEILESVDIEDTQGLQIASEEIHNLIVSAPFPEQLKDNILDSYDKIGGFVAVRSSATAEDLPEASFAGQQATFLNVKGHLALIDSVKRCWASLYSARAIYYRERNGFKHEEVLISVVVQKMVQSTFAGVMFTANPVSNNRDEIMIEGSFGLGEMVVSGMVTPDNYIIGKDLKIKDIYVSEKRRALYLGEDGKNKEIELDKERSMKRVLSDEKIIELAKIGLLIEGHYKKPQDIEWAYEDDKLFITQARPITTLR